MKPVFLVQFSNGAFQIMTEIQLGQHLHDSNQAPPYIYRLVPNRPPERRWVIRVNGSWMIGDMYRNMSEIRTESERNLSEI